MAGPFYERIVTQDELVVREWYTQKPPFIDPLYYSCGRVLVTKQLPTPLPAYANNHALSIIGYRSDEAYNQAYSRFRDKLGETAAWGENLAQYKQTFQAAVDLLELCLRPTKKIAKTLQGFTSRSIKGSRHRKSDWRGVGGRFVSIRDLSTSDRWLRPLKECNAAYLEWVYGLKPLLTDLSATIQVLDSSKDFSWDLETYGNAELSREDRLSWADCFRKWHCHAKLHATVTCTNPNLHKAESLGITNPVALAYQLIPFSFIFDYIYDIGGYLSALDDMFGLKLERAYTTQYHEGGGYDHYYGNTYGCDWTSMFMKRTPLSAFPAPRPYLKLNLSHWKAIHACSVLASIGLLRNR